VGVGRVARKPWSWDCESCSREVHRLILFHLSVTLMTSVNGLSKHIFRMYSESVAQGYLQANTSWPSHLSSCNTDPSWTQWGPLLVPVGTAHLLSVSQWKWDVNVGWAFACSVPLSNSKFSKAAFKFGSDFLCTLFENPAPGRKPEDCQANHFYLVFHDFA
jgi:hypothetical protein